MFPPQRSCPWRSATSSSDSVTTSACSTPSAGSGLLRVGQEGPGGTDPGLGGEPTSLLGRGAIAPVMLADGRFPSGSYAHSLGLEEAIARGKIANLAEVVSYAEGLLSTTAMAGAALAAAAARLCSALAARAEGSGPGETDGRRAWAALDAEADARMVSPAQRHTSRHLGRQLWRTVLGIPTWSEAMHLASFEPPDEGAHHAVVLGAATAAGGAGPRDAALIAAYGTVSSVCQAGVRLLGLDPVAVAAAVASLGPQIDSIADEACRSLRWEALPALSAPLADFFAEARRQREGTLFAS